MTPHDIRANGDIELTLMIEVTQALSNYLRYILVSAAALPGLIQDVARQIAPRTPPNANQILASPKTPRGRRRGSADKDHEPIAAAELVVYADTADADKVPITDDAIDLVKVRITRLPARRARGL